MPEPSDHRPSRPDWGCVIDGEDWPCEEYRAYVWKTYRDVIARGMHMGEFFAQAVVELPEPEEQGAIHARFLGWIREPATPVPYRGHPPGGVL